MLETCSCIIVPGIWVQGTWYENCFSGKTYTEVLQKWNIPGEAQNTEYLLFSGLVFEKAHVQKCHHISEKGV